MRANFHQPVVPELTVREAAELLGVSPRTVLRMVAQGLLRYRSAALPTSLRPRYRIPRIDVLELRGDYLYRTRTPQVRRVKGEATIEDDLRILGLD